MNTFSIIDQPCGNGNLRWRHGDWKLRLPQVLGFGFSRSGSLMKPTDRHPGGIAAFTTCRTIRTNAIDRPDIESAVSARLNSSHDIESCRISIASLAQSGD